jgi:hypothetical protein
MTDRANPLESVFNIEPGSTPTFADPSYNVGNERASTLIDPTSGEMLPRTIEPDSTELEKEERIEDLHIDSQLEGIHDNAIIAFEKQARMADEVDPKFAARNAEVAAQYLNIALNAVNSRVDAKFKRQKVRLAKNVTKAPNTVNNNVFVADRNAMLDQIFGKREPITIESETDVENEV